MHLLLYLDPGSGSFLIQLLLGLLLGGALAVRMFWSNIKALFTGKKATPLQLTTTILMMSRYNPAHLAASFRDPSGFLFERDGVLYRQVNQRYQADYDCLMTSGLYERLVKKQRLVAHEETSAAPEAAELAYKVLRPERVAFISYPYEWSFSQLKDAALLTLALEKRAIQFGMSLKDASAYNIQFQNGHPILIDTLSFEVYAEGKPWVAYRQFCQHFLAPLALMRYRDVRLEQLLRVYIDGVPLDLASKLLPLRSRMNPGILTHIHLHAAAQQRYAGENIGAQKQTGTLSRNSLLGLIESLENTVRGLKWEPKGTEWGDYYDATNYTRAAFDAKAALVKEFVEETASKVVWDLGSNTGVFSRLAAAAGAFTVSWDVDPAAVEKNYLDMKQKKETNLLPLVIDLTNPSAGMGWMNTERDSFFGRGPVDMVLALALMHHLAISNNVPLPDLADFFAGLGHWLVIEFVPKSDSQVRRLLSTREDIFPDYNEENFERAMGEYFALRKKCPVEGSLRTLYLMERK